MLLSGLTGLRLLPWPRDQYVAQGHGINTCGRHNRHRVNPSSKGPGSHAGGQGPSRFLSLVRIAEHARNGRAEAGHSINASSRVGLAAGAGPMRRPASGMAWFPRAAAVEGPNSPGWGLVWRRHHVTGLGDRKPFRRLPWRTLAIGTRWGLARSPLRSPSCACTEHARSAQT